MELLRRPQPSTQCATSRCFLEALVEKRRQLLRRGLQGARAHHVRVEDLGSQTLGSAALHGGTNTRHHKQT